MYCKKTFSIIRTLIFLFALFNADHSFSQTPDEDLLKMGKKMGALKSYDMIVDVKVYKTINSKEPSYATKAHTMKSENNYYVDILGRKTIVNNNLMIVVDEKQKMILYNLIPEEQQKNAQSSQIINVDSIYNSAKSKIKSRYVIKSADEKKIELTNLEGQVKTMIISFNPATYALKEIVYVYSDDVVKNSGNQKVVISYTKFLMECHNKAVFDQSGFVKVKNNKVSLTDKYKNYKLITPRGF